MQRVRHILQRHPALLAGVLLCALLMRLLVPAGYMPAVAGGAIVLELCPGTMPAEPLASAMPGMDHQKHAPEKHTKTEQPCAYAGLAVPVLGAADPALLATALAFAFLLALLPLAPLAPTRRPRLRPPLRAPPLPA